MRKLWVAQALSGIGDWAARLALTVLVFERTGSALEAATVYAAAMVPYLIAPFVTARLRRLARRDVLIGCDLVRFCVFAAMATEPSTPALLALMFVGSLPSPVFEATRLGVLPGLVPPDRTADALVLQQTTSQMVTAVGFLAGGALLVVLHPSGALLTNAVSFLASAALISSLPRCRVAPPPRPVGTTRHLAAAAGAIWRKPAVRMAALFSLTLSPGTMACEAIVASYAHHLHASHAIGWLAASPAAAVVVAGLALSRRGDDRQLLQRSALASLAGAVAAAVAFWSANSLPLGIFAFLAIGSVCAATPLLVTVAIRGIDERLLPSAMALVQAMLMTLNVLGALAGGLLATALSPRLTCVLASLSAAAYPLWVGIRLRRPLATTATPYLSAAGVAITTGGADKSVA